MTDPYRDSAIDEFTNALAEKLKKGNVTPTEIKQLANQYAKKAKRGRPKKAASLTPKDKKGRGRPRDDESMTLKFKVMGLWVMLSRVDMPQMEKRHVISKAINKSYSFVNKAIDLLHKLVDSGLAVACYSPETGKGILLPMDDAVRLQALWEQGANIDEILEAPEYFNKLALPGIILQKIDEK